MQKLRKILFLFLAFFIAFPKIVFAQENFSTDVIVNYVVNDSGVSQITYNIQLYNETSNYYASAFNLSLTGIQVDNPVAHEGGKSLKLIKENKGETVNMKVEFDTPVVGKGNHRDFSISFTNGTIAAKTGEVWEISIPKIANEKEFRNYTVKLSVPDSFGELAYVSPEAGNVESNGSQKTYVFYKSTIEKSGVVAAFGQFQVFEFDLTYHLENPLAKTAIAEIAIPPDTAYQRVNYSKLTPEPDTVTLDDDGNWLAVYKLKSRERVDVKATGAVQIFSGPRYTIKESKEDLQENLKPSEVWQTESESILAASKNLSTPREVYDYVVNTLNYDYDRVKPNVERLGAEKALRNPNSAICMEFTDLFIALARASGIPAREVNGFAYTENPELQPLSLVADVLHSWPEYWDKDKGVWVPVDPTWGDTTGGVDYFSKLDLRHFTFVIHGKDAYKPYPPGSYKLGSSPQKDVYVNFGKLNGVKVGEPKITLRQESIIPFVNTKVVANIKNVGGTAIDEKDVDIYFDATKVYTTKIKTLPPYASINVERKIPFSILGYNTPTKIEVSYASKSAILPTQKPTVIILSLGIILALITAFVTYQLVKSQAYGRIKTTLKKLFSRQNNA